MFKKGSFEIGGTIYPVAIKVFVVWHLYIFRSPKRVEPCYSLTLSFSQYDPQFGDAFWNSAKYNMVSYLLRMMSSWAIVCNVWYLPPMNRQVRKENVLMEMRVQSLRPYHLILVGAFFRMERMPHTSPTGSNRLQHGREDWSIYPGENTVVSSTKQSEGNNIIFVFINGLATLAKVLESRNVKLCA